MTIHVVREILIRGLSKLEDYISQYESEEDIWYAFHGSVNSAGNLSLHLIGNLNMYIGGVIGNTGYKRKREEEFTIRVNKDVLLTQIQETKEVLESTLQESLTLKLEEVFPVKIAGSSVSVHYLLLDLIDHFAYHLGQVSYHYRIIKNAKQKY